jgi:hypothetical protein
MITARADVMDAQPSNSPIVYKRRKYASWMELAVFSETGLFLGSLNVEILAKTAAGVLIGSCSVTDLDEGRIKR